MIKSVWLVNLIVKLLQKKDNILYSSYCFLAKRFFAENGQIILFEPDGSVLETIYVSEDSVWKGKGFEQNLPLREQFAEDVIIPSEEGFYIPLHTEKTSVFGFVFFEKNDMNSAFETDPSVLELIHAFSAVMYSEAIGSIIESYNESMVTVKDLCVDYKISKRTSRVVKGVSFNICKGEFTVILGASGCGKTTMLNAIGGMLSPSEGSVIWNDTDVAKMNEKQKVSYRRNIVGFVFQRYNLIRNLTAEENIYVSAGMAKDPLPVKEVLEMVGLAEKARSYPNQMSGGEQQRVCIARALVKKPQLLLCDEPTGALDSRNAENIIRILQKIAKEQHIPVVVITHNPQLSVMADHYLFMSNGKIEDEFYQPFPVSAENISLS